MSSLNVICPKCRYADQSVAWHEAHWNMPKCSLGSAHTSEAEHLHLTCLQCGYDWITETADAARVGVPVVVDEVARRNRRADPAREAKQVTSSSGQIEELTASVGAVAPPEGE